jgi:hypothetical protein
MQRLVERSAQATGTLLVASGGLIAPAAAGLGSSLPLAAALFAVALLLYAGREDFAALGRVAGYHVGPVLRVAWVGAVLAALVVIAARGASPGELLAYGGLFGLLGMVNYFLRPVYGLLLAAGRYVTRSRKGGRQL